MTLRQLRAFVAVARTRSFNRAAKELFLTPSAMSETIRQLEDALALKVFDRTTRSVELTAAGVEFLTDASQVLRLLDASVVRMGALGSAAVGRVQVSGVASVHAQVTAPCIAALMTQRPGLQFVLVEDEIDGIVSSVLEGSSDFGVGVVPGDREATLDTLPLLTDRYGVIAHRRHDVFKIKRLELSALSRWHYIGVALGDEMDRRLASIPLTSRVSLNGPSSMIALLECSDGFGILPSLAAARMLTPQLRFKAFVGPEYVRKVSLIARAGRSLSPAAQLLWTAMQEAGKTLKRSAVGR